MKPERMTVSDGTEIAYAVDDFIDPWIEDNKKDTIIMQMGIETMKPLVPAFARKYRVVRFDERGHGASGITPGGYKTSTDRFIEDIIELADHLGVGKFIMYGAGSAGMGAIGLALKHPDRLKCLILQTSPYRFEPEVANRYLQGESDLGAAIVKAGSHREWAKRVPGGWQTLNPEKVDPKVIQWLRAYRDKDPEEAKIGRYSWAGTVDFKDQIKDIKVPTLLMNMGHSYQVPLEQGRFMAQVNPRIKVVTLEGDYGAPNIQLVVPDQISKVALEYLASLPAAA